MIKNFINFLKNRSLVFKLSVSIFLSILFAKKQVHLATKALCTTKIPGSQASAKKRRGLIRSAAGHEDRELVRSDCGHSPDSEHQYGEDHTEGYEERRRLVHKQ